jgi:hypothetical protein
MRLSAGGQWQDVPLNNLSIDPQGYTVCLAADGRFYVEAAGLYQPYYDPSLGQIRFGNRSYVVTTATSFVRDGQEFVAFLPFEQKFVTKAAWDEDSRLREFSFNKNGLFAPRHCRRMAIYGAKEEVAISRDLAGRLLATRVNGEILDLSSGGARPYRPKMPATGGRFIRLDLAVPSDGTETPGILTLFYAPRTAPGAKRWLRHFLRTEEMARTVSLRATPFLRNFNVIHYNGPEDLQACVARLQDTVDTINTHYESQEKSSENGKLHRPTVENVNSAMLNQLHMEFEAFGDRFKSGGEDHSVLSRVLGPFCQLNDAIHACEGAYANRDRGLEEAWWSIHASFLPDLYDSLSMDIYEEFTLDWDFGTLFMGYHTLGKDYTAAFWNSDDELIRRGEVRPQRISSAEIFAYFGPDSRGQKEAMRRWWQEKGLEAQGHAFDDPTNAIGYIPVARLDTLGLEQAAIKRTLKPANAVVAVSSALI